MGAALDGAGGNLRHDAAEARPHSRWLLAHSGTEANVLNLFAQPAKSDIDDLSQTLNPKP